MTKSTPATTPVLDPATLRHLIATLRQVAGWIRPRKGKRA